MTQNSPLIVKLKAQEAELKKKIREAQRTENKKAAATHNEKCRVIGAAILTEIKNNAALEETLQPIIEKHTTGAKDRKLLGLAPLPKTEKKEESANADT